MSAPLRCFLGVLLFNVGAAWVALAIMQPFSVGWALVAFNGSALAIGGAVTLIVGAVDWTSTR